MHKSSWFKCFIAATFLILAPFSQAAQESEFLGTQLVAIDINSADAQTIAETLIGVGMVRAKEIIAYREMYGSFKTVEELLEVQGIGEATVDKNRHLIKLLDN